MHNRVTELLGVGVTGSSSTANTARTAREEPSRPRPTPPHRRANCTAASSALPNLRDATAVAKGHLVLSRDCEHFFGHA